MEIAGHTSLARGIWVTKNIFKKLAADEVSQLQPPKFVLNCDVVLFTAALRQISTLSREWRRKTELSRAYHSAPGQCKGRGSRKRGEAAAPQRSTLGDPMPIGRFCRRLETGQRDGTHVFAHVLNFLNICAC